MRFNQTVLVQAPPGVIEADVLIMLQALLDRHAMLRLRVDSGIGNDAADGAGGWSRNLVADGARTGFGGLPLGACTPSTCYPRTR